MYSRKFVVFIIFFFHKILVYTRSLKFRCEVQKFEHKVENKT